MGLQTPYCELADIKVNAFEGEQNAGAALMMKNGNVLEFAAVLQYTRLGQHIVDTVKPLLRCSAAALEYQTFFFSHTP